MAHFTSRPIHSLSQVTLLATVAVPMYRFDLLNMHMTFDPYEGCLSQLG